MLLTLLFKTTCCLHIARRKKKKLQTPKFWRWTSIPIPFLSSYLSFLHSLLQSYWLPFSSFNLLSPEKGMTEDEMAGWHHRLDGHEFEQALWVADGQGILACCSLWGHKESDTTERLNLTDVLLYLIYLCICFYLMILFLNLFTYLAALGLSCGTQEL